MCSISRMNCISPPTISVISSRKRRGKTPQEHIHIKLVDKAKELLCATNKSVSEIAYELGFKYPHHLSRMFKKNTGFSPSEFRLSA